MAMRPYLGTARRLFVAFAALVSMFAVSSYLALAHLGEIHEGLVEMSEQEQGVRLSLELASAVRDQYAHQAHTIILGNASHLPLYDAAEKRVVELTEAVRRRAGTPAERAWVDDIARATANLDAIFRRQIVPAVLSHSEADVQAEHARAQVQVSLIQERADRLVERFETGIRDVETRVGALQHEAFRWTLFFLVGSPIVAAAVGLYVLRSVARPMARVTAGAARLAEGDLDARIDVDTPDEFGDLARQFNAMTASLKEHQARLVESEKLAGVGRLAAGVAHEINNPLAVILGYVRLLRKKAEGPLAEDLAVIEEETLRSREIVEGLLDLSRPIAVEREDVDLRAVCDEAVARLADTRKLDGVRVDVEGEARVEGTASKLRQVFLNLVQNGAEAAGAGGGVEVRIAPSDGGAEISIADTGPGVAPEARSRMFEPFFTTKPAGTGLGLAVSQGIVRAHGGDIAIESAAPRGARFVVRLPARTPAKG
jgi:signal transduction histidine kinase